MWQDLQNRWAALEPGKRKLIAILAVATLLTAGTSSFVLHSRGQMTLLYSGLPAQETREIAAELAKQNIDYSLSDDESTIHVPSRDEPRARMRLASAGLPRSTPEKGWEIFGEGGLAVTKPQQQAMQIRALQGELSRSIASLENVTKAAVHISLKQESPFVNEQEPAKAAVLLNVRGGATITREQATAIAYLVARSVPDLDTAQVTILDGKGKLLFSENLARGGGSDDGSKQVEKDIERRVQSQLDQTFGLGKAIVRATAVVRTERTEVKRTTYTPADGTKDGIPGKETSETEQYDGSAAASKAGGVPGTGANLFNQQGGAGGGGNGGRYTRGKTDRDYKVNEEQQMIVQPGGNIARLTLGIFVDDTLKAQLTQIETVARNAAGIDEKRGDSLSVEAVKFSGSNVDGLTGLTRVDMIKTIARLILNALALIIGLLTLRSIVSALKPTGVGTPELLLAAGGEPGLTSLSEPMPMLTANGGGAAGAAGAGGVPVGAGLSGQGAEATLTGSAVSVPGAGSSLLDAGDDDGFDPTMIPTATGPTPEELIGRVESTAVDDIAEVLRHWLEGDLDEQ